MPWKIFEENGKSCVYKLAPDGGKGDLVTCHDTTQEAEAHLKALYANAEPMAAERVFDVFVATQPGHPYRLLPFGPIKRATGGPARNLTPEMAAQFRLPHFQPPIKLGSHEDATPAGGHIASLFVRNDGDPKTDGLWAAPTLTEKGARAWGEGDYRYHSPEIIWPGGGIEDATTGQFIPGPLVVGDALLHVPALGEATALYTSQINQGESMTAETVQIEKSAWDKLMALVTGGTPAAPQTPSEPVIPDEYKAAMQERDELKAKMDQLEAERLHAEAVTTMTATLKNPERFSSAFKDDKAAGEAAEKLAALPKESQDWFLQQFSAMAKRIDYSKLTAEIGSAATEQSTDPRQAFSAVVSAKMKAEKCSYEAAYNLVKDEAPDLFEAYAAYVPGKAKGE